MRPPVVVALISLAVTAVDGALLALALGGIPALLAHPRALVLLAVYAVSGMSLALMRPVRDQDAVATRRDPKWRMLLLFLLPLLTPALSAFGERAGLLLLPGRPWIGWAGIALVAAGLTLRIAAMARLGPRFAPIVAMQREHAIETGGPYAFVRHPGYLGAWVAALGATLTFANALAMPLVVLFAALLAARAREEEALLAQHLGDAWHAYAQKTGAFLPKLGG